MSQTGDQGPDRQLTGARPGFAHLRRPGPPRSSSAHPQRGPRCGQLGVWVSAVEQRGPEEPLMGAGRGAGTPAPSAAPRPGPPAPAVPLHPAPGARCPPVQGGQGVWTLSTCGQWPKPVSQVSQGPCGTAWRGLCLLQTQGSLRAREGRPAGGQLCPRRTPHTDPPRDLWPAGQQSSVLWAEPGGRHSLGGLPRVCGSASAHGTWIGWHLASPTCAPFLPAPPSAAGVGAAWAGSGRGAGGATGRGPSFRVWWVCRWAEALEHGPRSGGGSHGRKGTRRRGGRRSPGAPRHAVRGGRARRSSCSGVGRSHTPRRCRSVSPQHADRPQEVRARGLPAVRSVQPWPQTQRGPGLPSGGRPSPRPRHGSAARPDPLVWASHVGSHTARERLHPASSASAVGPCEVRASR